MNRWLAVASVFALAGVAVVSAAAADVREEVWHALKGRQVYVEQTDGTSVRGTLGSVEGKRVGVVRKDGIVAVVEKDRVRLVRAAEAAEAPSAVAPPFPSAPPPIGAAAPAVALPPLAAPPPFSPPPMTGSHCGMSAPGMAVFGCGHGDAMGRVISTIELTPPGGLLKALLSLPEAARLNPYDQVFLLSRYEHDGISAGVAVALNLLLLPGLGSFFQRDYVGGVLSLGSVVGGYAILLKNLSSCGYGGSGCGGSGSIGVGVGLILGGWLFGIIRPWFYESPRARALKNFFLRKLRVAGTSFELSPTFDVGQGSRVGEEQRMAPALPGSTSRSDFATATQITGGIEARF